MNSLSRMEKLRLLGFGAILVAIFFGGFFLVLRKFVNPRATAGVPGLSFTTSPATLTAGGNFDLSVKVNPNGASFYAFELYFTYDTSKVELQDVSNPQNNITSQYLVAQKDISGGKVTVIGTRTGSPFTGSTDQEIAVVKFKVKAGVTGAVNFAWDGATKLGSNLTIAKTDGSFTVGAGGSGAKLYFSSGQNAYPGGESFDLNLLLDTNGNQVKSVDFNFIYDGAKLTFQNASDPPSNIVLNQNSGFNTGMAVKNVDQANMKISIGLPSSSPVSGNGINLGVVKFKVKDGLTDGSFNFTAANDSNVYNQQTQNILSDKPTLTIGIGKGNSTNGGNVTLNLKLKFQGIAGKPKDAENSLVVRAKVGNSVIGTSDYGSGTFTADANGIWTGSINVSNAPTGQGLIVYVKGPKHVQKKICDPAPTETKAGTYHCSTGKITLNDGANTFDFSGIVELAGDLPTQDGVVDSYDTSLVFNNLGKTDDAALKLADVNLDGVVDTQDYSLIVASLSVKQDEE